MACYHIFNGNVSFQLRPYAPCTSPLQKDSVQCCAAGDNCYAGGICQGSRQLDFISGTSGFYASGCTDPTGKSSECLQACDAYAVNDIVWLEDKQLWSCCGGVTGNATCSNPVGPTFKAPAPDKLAFYNTTLPSSTSSLTSSTTFPSVPSSSSTSSADAVDSLPSTSVSSSETVKIAIGVSAGLGGLVLLVLISLLLWMLLKMRRQGKALKEIARALPPQRDEREILADPGLKLMHEKLSDCLPREFEKSGESSKRELEGSFAPHHELC